MSLFELSGETIEIAGLVDQFSDPAAGAFVTFEGWVRAFNEGRKVRALAYEAYEPLALKEGQRVVKEAVEKTGARAAFCIHRTGLLEIGELAVWVGVSAIHRAEAFDCCRRIINEIKVRLPVWKKEFYADGDSGWVNCEHCAREAVPGVGL